MATDKQADKGKSAPVKKSDNQPNPASRYFRETRGELKKVTWPTREETIRLTGIVLAVTALTSIFLWAFDSAFSQSIQALVNLIIGA